MIRGKRCGDHIEKHHEILHGMIGLAILVWNLMQKINIEKTQSYPVKISRCETCTHRETHLA